MNMPTFLWRIDFKVPKAHREVFEDILEPYCLALTSFENEKTNESVSYTHLTLPTNREV